MKAQILKKVETRSSLEYFELVAANYAEKYELDPSFRERFQVWTRLIDKYTACADGNSLVMDIGCGTGGFCRYVANKGMKAVGVDQSEGMLAQARAIGEAENAEDVLYWQSSIPLSSANVQAWQARANMILCSSVLEYVEDYQSTLRQFYELLKPGGVALISLPNKASVYRRMQTAVGKLPLSRLSYLNHQIHQWFPAEVASDVERVGFKLIESAFYALPFHRLTEKLLRQNRPDWLATMFLAVVQK